MQPPRHRVFQQRSERVLLRRAMLSGKGGDVITKTHAVGSAMTYGRRCVLRMIFNVAIGEDDDGNCANIRAWLSLLHISWSW
jgi:hypothetical protein